MTEIARPIFMAAIYKKGQRGFLLLSGLSLSSADGIAPQLESASYVPTVPTVLLTLPLSSFATICGDPII